jgi:hypothetical protein
MTLDRPKLYINYSRELDLRVHFVKAQRYHGGHMEYFFEVKCRVRHPTGYFEYFVDHLCFQPRDFSDLANQLHAIHQGAADNATLKNVGEMFVFQLQRAQRKLRLTLDIREYVPPGIGNLNVALDVDYDLFVNKLLEEVRSFSSDLEDVKIENL